MKGYFELTFISVQEVNAIQCCRIRRKKKKKKKETEEAEIERKRKRIKLILWA
jgi:hypothetical protein